MSGGKRRWTCVQFSCFLSALGSQANPPLSSIFPHHYFFLNGPAVGHPFSPMRGHLGTTGQDKLATHGRRKLLSGLGGTFLEWLSALETWSWTWAFPLSCPYQCGLSLGKFSGGFQGGPTPMPRDQLFSVLLPGGFLRTWTQVGLHVLRAGEGSGAQQLKSQHTGVRSSSLSSALSSQVLTGPAQGKHPPPPAQHKLPLPKLAPFWVRWPEKASLKDQFKVGHVT